MRHNAKELEAAPPKNGPSRALKDYYFRCILLSSRRRGEGTAAISAVRMLHVHDPFRRSFEYPDRVLREKPIVSMAPLGPAGYFFNAIKQRNKDDDTPPRMLGQVCVSGCLCIFATKILYSWVRVSETPERLTW